MHAESYIVFGFRLTDDEIPPELPVWDEGEIVGSRSYDTAYEFGDGPLADIAFIETGNGWDIDEYGNERQFYVTSYIQETNQNGEVLDLKNLENLIPSLIDTLKKGCDDSNLPYKTPGFIVISELII